MCRQLPSQASTVIIFFIIKIFNTVVPSSYYLQFESTRGWRYTGDIALDDISLSPQCFQLLDLTLDTTTPDPATTITMTEPLSSQSIESGGFYGCMIEGLEGFVDVMSEWIGALDSIKVWCFCLAECRFESRS